MRKFVLTGGAVGFLVLTLSCGGSNPANPTPSTTPTPKPTPTPEPSPTGLTCTVPPISDPDGCNPWTGKNAPQASYLNELVATIDTLKREKPDLFSYSGKNNRFVQVTNVPAFFRHLQRVLERDYGLCSAYNVRGLPKDEISIKNSNDSSEQYDVLASDNLVWWSYQATCRPPVF